MGLDSAEAADGQIRIWSQQHEPMDPACLVSTVQAGGGSGGEGLVPLILVNHGLNTTACLSIFTDPVLPFLATVHDFLVETSCRIMIQVTEQKSPTGLMNRRMSSVDLSAPPHKSPDLDPVEPSL